MVYGPAPVSKTGWFKIAMNQDTSYTFHAPCTDKPDALILAVECWVFCRDLVRFTVGNPRAIECRDSVRYTAGNRCEL
jgi:hypothetical protein